MKAASTISYILAGILIFFSLLFMWGSFSQAGQASWLAIGILGMLIGFALIFAGYRFAAKAKPVKQEINVKLDLPGNVKLDTIKCESCGAPLSPQDITLRNGAAVVSCPACGTTYQITEEPKW